MLFFTCNRLNLQKAFLNLEIINRSKYRGMNKKEITIYDIAEKLKLSPSTVSRGLQDHPAINKNTKQKINDLAFELGYRSNKFASNLRKQRTNTIGVIIPKLDSLFMSSVISGIEKVANNAGYNLIISQSFESQEKEQTNASTMYNSRVDGLIISLSNETKDFKHLDMFVDKGIPLIFFDRVTDNPLTTKVVIDNFKAGHTATTHLIEQGCRNILHITGNLTRNVYNDRLSGFKKAIEDNGLALTSDSVISNTLREEDIRDCLENDILKRKPLPDGIFIANDFAAAFTIVKLKEAGLRVPEDVAVIGFNNDLISKVTEPPISTINYPGKEMGESVARILVNQLEQKENTSITSTIILDTELIVRKSSQKR